MYTSRGFREWEIGDIDVIRRGRNFHLFHLVLPNHDYIAHAISQDGMTWMRTRNAIFTGEPGTWDDDMLWTMHVSYHPVRKLYEMFYTGLHRAENGYFQRIGRAVSRDLMAWRKENEQNLPLLPTGVEYEGPGYSERGWVSFRDPFLWRDANQDWLLLCARVIGGPVSRRGCVGLVRRTPEGYQIEPPLYFPRMYDDFECPCLVELEGTFYLIGSIREDVEVHYWWCETFQGEYRAFNNNVLLPKGNYAARAMRDGARTPLPGHPLEALEACIDGRLDETELRWAPGASACVVASSAGYPGSYKTGFPITGLSAASRVPGVQIFHSGSTLAGGQMLTGGGRVLGVTAAAPSLLAALKDPDPQIRSWAAMTFNLLLLYEQRNASESAVKTGKTSTAPPLCSPRAKTSLEIQIESALLPALEDPLQASATQ